MTADDFPERAPSRAWLVTLADLALLLVGFFVLLQANKTVPPQEIVRGIAAGLGTPAPAPMAVAAERIDGFAPGGVTAPTIPPRVIAWAKEAARDPRLALTVAGTTDGSPADRDPTGNATLLAVDRARAVAAALADAGVPTERLTIVNADRDAARGRTVIITLGFAGEKEKE